MHGKILALVVVCLMLAGGLVAMSTASEQTAHNRTAEFDAVVTTVFDIGAVLPWVIIGGALVSVVAIWRRAAP